MIQQFRLPEDNSVQRFICTYRNRTTHISGDRIIIDHTPSLVANSHSTPKILKFVKPRSWHEYVKLLWNHSRVTKEVKGNKKLKGMGFRVPDIYEVGVTLMPFMKPKYIGYYIMEDLHASGFCEANTVLESTEKKDLTCRKKIIQDVYNGLKTLRDRNIVFSDFHFDNVLYHNNGELAWIDTGVTSYITNGKKFRNKFDHSILRLTETNFSKHLNQDEKNYLRTLLFNNPTTDTQSTGLKNETFHSANEQVPYPDV